MEDDRMTWGELKRHIDKKIKKLGYDDDILIYNIETYKPDRGILPTVSVLKSKQMTGYDVALDVDG